MIKKEISRLAFCFCLNKFNKNSFIALICALEKNEQTKNIPIYVIDVESKEFDKEFLNNLSQYKKVVFMWSFFSFAVEKSFRLLNELKKILPENFINIAGGPHASGAPVETLKAGFDYVVIGEGEKTIRDLCDCVIKSGDISQVKGIGYLNKNKFIFTGKQEYVDLNDFSPFPQKYRMIGPLEITRGCPWGCRYCQTTYLFGKVPRHRDICEARKYARKLRRNGMKDIRFITPNALSYGSTSGKNVNLEAIEDLLKTVKKELGKDSRIFFGSFPSELRPDQISQKALDIIKKYCNNDNLIIGAQSGSERMLKLIGRGHTTNDVKNAVKLAVESGFSVNVDFIFGLPKENKEDRKETFYLVEELIKIGALIHGHFFMPLPGTPFADGKPASLSADEIGKLKKLELAKKLYGSWEGQQPKS